MVGNGTGGIPEEGPQDGHLNDAPWGNLRQEFIEDISFIRLFVDLPKSSINRIFLCVMWDLLLGFAGSVVVAWP